MNQFNSSNGLEAQLREVSRLMRSGDGQTAITLLASLQKAHSKDCGLLRMYGIALAQFGRLKEAESQLRTASSLQPDSPMAASDHASVLISLSRHEEALQVLMQQHGGLEQVANIHDRATFLFNLGRAYKLTGQAGDAVKPLQQVLDLQPKHYGALITLGDVYKALGHADKAAESFRRAIAANPQDATAWWSLSNLKAGAFKAEEIEQLKQVYQSGPKPPGQQMMFEFALASACDQRNHIDQAFAHYRSGNQLARQREPWDHRQFSDWLGKLEMQVQKVSLPERPQRFAGPRPVFIVSLPRSGSTLVEQIFAAHSQVTAASELPWVPQLIAEESARKGSGLASWLEQQSPEAWRVLGEQYLRRSSHWSQFTPVFTDKLPGNLPYIGAILSMLPEALVIGVRRDAMDVCWSCYRQLLMGGSEFVYDLQSLAAYWKDFESHMNFWQEQASSRVISVQYEQLVQNPENETRRLLEFAGLDFEMACLSPQSAKRAVNTASALQVREAIHGRGLGHWKRYAAHLAELEQALGPARAR
jgi:tetratricopeptide (TPR) repeat protein